MNSFIKWLRQSLSSRKQPEIAHPHKSPEKPNRPSKSKAPASEERASASADPAPPRERSPQRHRQPEGGRGGQRRPSRPRHREESERSEVQSTREPLAGLPGNPRIVSREEHSISRRLIDPDALKVLYRFIQHGRRAFLVGGGVRDLLLGREPKDYDISSDVPPEEIRSIFRNSRIIGRRFKLNHVYFRGGKIIEVSTFRSASEAESDETESDGRVAPNRNDNTFGDPETDAYRRDLTINGMFYDLRTFSVIDYVGGIDDLRAGIVRMIGEPDVRIQQDPVRMIRAVRHAARTGFKIEPKTSEAIHRQHDLILQSPKARVYEELMRELHGGSSRRSYQLLQEYGLLKHLVPVLSEVAKVSPAVNQSIELVLERVDAHIALGHELSAGVTFAALLVEHILASDRLLSQMEKEGLTPLFQLHPLQQKADSEADSEEEEDEEDDRPPSSYSFRGKRTALMNAVDTLCRPIGVSKKERERMEDLLLLRWELIMRAARGEWSKAPLRNEHFEEALLLIQLSGSTPLLDETLEFWGADEVSSTPRPRRDQHQPREEGRPGGGRRRNSRRRGGRGRRPRQ